MPHSNELHTHLWIGGPTLEQVSQDGRTLLHHRCGRCWRDFGQGFDGVYSWEAVYVGVFRIERLSEDVTERWLLEPCPQQHHPEDDVARTTRRNGIAVLFDHARQSKVQARQLTKR